MKIRKKIEIKKKKKSKKTERSKLEIEVTKREVEKKREEKLLGQLIPQLFQFFGSSSTRTRTNES